MKKLLLFSVILLSSCSVQDIAIITEVEKACVKNSVSDYISDNIELYKILIDSIPGYENVTVQYMPAEFITIDKNDSSFESTGFYKYHTNLIEICSKEKQRVDSLILKGFTSTYVYYSKTYSMDCNEYKAFLSNVIHLSDSTINVIRNNYTDVVYSAKCKYQYIFSFSANNQQKTDTSTFEQRFVLNNEFNILWVENK